MALIKCAECGTDISTSAKACPRCGAEPPKKTSKSTWVVGGIFAMAFVSYIAGEQKLREQRAAMTPEQITEEAKKTEARHKASVQLRAIKRTLRDPDSVKWEYVATTKDGSAVCVQYRAKNGFGGFARERLVSVNGLTTSAENVWIEYCRDDPNVHSGF